MGFISDLIKHVPVVKSIPFVDKVAEIGVDAVLFTACPPAFAAKKVADVAYDMKFEHKSLTSSLLGEAAEASMAVGVGGLLAGAGAAVTSTAAGQAALSAEAAAANAAAAATEASTAAATAAAAHTTAMAAAETAAEGAAKTAAQAAAEAAAKTSAEATAHAAAQQTAADAARTAANEAAKTASEGATGIGRAGQSLNKVTGKISSTRPVNWLNESFKSNAGKLNTFVDGKLETSTSKYAGQLADVKAKVTGGVEAATKFTTQQGERLALSEQQAVKAAAQGTEASAQNIPNMAGDTQRLVTARTNELGPAPSELVTARPANVTPGSGGASAVNSQFAPPEASTVITGSSAPLAPPAPGTVITGSSAPLAPPAPGSAMESSLVPPESGTPSPSDGKIAEAKNKTPEESNRPRTPHKLKKGSEAKDPAVANPPAQAHPLANVEGVLNEVSKPTKSKLASFARKHALMIGMFGLPQVMSMFGDKHGTSHTVTAADGTQASVTYDSAGNPIVTDASGAQIAAGTGGATSLADQGWFQEAQSATLRTMGNAANDVAAGA